MAKDLAAFLSDDFTEADVSVVRDVASAMATERTWTLGPPEFVDESDEAQLSNPEDEVIRTVGVVLTVSDRGERPETQRGEVELFVRFMSEVSRLTGLRIEVQLGAVHCGTIVNGVPSSSIKVGLIDSW